eukprot:Skav235046  [mRNA]  locus=scaffold7855:41:2752:+ [translate_table: standard]
MRVKRDVIPGRYQSVWFEPTKMGDFHLFCAEYCGDDHSRMYAKLHVVDAETYAKEPWNVAGGDEPGLFKKDGDNYVGTPRDVIENGETKSITVDEEYIKESIAMPSQKIVARDPYNKGGMSAFDNLDEKRDYLNCSKGIMSWLVAIAFLSGGLFALLVRLHLWEPEGLLFTNQTYNQIFTLHGAFMVFLFVIPAIPGSIGNMVLPLMVGAKDVALPRLNLLSFYLWLTGAVLAALAIIMGGFDTGWTFYAPYSIYTDQAVVTIGLAIFILGFSSIFTGLNFIVTFIMGSRGMPRRYATYVPEYADFHQWSTIGAMILGAGVALMVFYLVASLLTGKKAKENQWGGVTLDWRCPTPPPHLNFDDEPKGVPEGYSTLDYESMQRGAPLQHAGSGVPGGQARLLAVPRHGNPALRRTVRCLLLLPRDVPRDVRARRQAARLAARRPQHVGAAAELVDDGDGRAFGADQPEEEDADVPGAHRARRGDLHGHQVLRVQGEERARPDRVRAPVRAL